MKSKLLKGGIGLIALAVHFLPTQTKAHTTVEKCCATYNGVETCATCAPGSHGCWSKLVNGVHYVGCTPL